MNMVFAAVYTIMLFVSAWAGLIVVCAFLWWGGKRKSSFSS